MSNVHDTSVCSIGCSFLTFYWMRFSIVLFSTWAIRDSCLSVGDCRLDEILTCNLDSILSTWSLLLPWYEVVVDDSPIFGLFASNFVRRRSSIESGVLTTTLLLVGCWLRSLSDLMTFVVSSSDWDVGGFSLPPLTFSLVYQHEFRRVKMNH